MAESPETESPETGSPETGSPEVASAGDEPVSTRPPPLEARKVLSYIGLGALVLVLGLGLSFLWASRQTRSSDRPEIGGSQTVVDIGPIQGRDIPQYLTDAATALGKAQGTRVAVVSLSRFVTEPEARGTVGKTDVIALLAAAPGGSPSVVTGGLPTWAADQKSQAAAQEAELKKMLPTVDDPDFVKTYQSEIARDEALQTKVDPKGSVVFGVVIRAPADSLRALAKVNGIRLVDVGPSGKASSGASYAGLRPEETVKAGEPRTRPA